MFEDGTDRQYRVVRNEQEQYSIWPVSHELPTGWVVAGVTGTKQQCLEQISQVWTDLRPGSLRQARAGRAGS